MREIKFRAWHKADEKMYEVYGFTSSKWFLRGKDFPMPSGAVVPMQFTGLTDSNDVEIYEGDILEDFIGKQRYEVIWDDYGMFLFNPVGTEGNAIDYYEFEDEASRSATIVVGNKYENPKLLKETATFID